MSAEKLAFLQNFYTDVTLYMPAEPAPAAPAPAQASAAPPVATPAPAKAPSPAPPKPAREVLLPPTGFSRPSAGLDRLAASFKHSAGAIEPSAQATERSAHPSEGSAHPSDGSAHPSDGSAHHSGRSAQGLLPGSEAPAERPAAPAVPPVMLTQFSTLGDNAQGVVLLFRLSADEFRKLHRNVFLNKMLQALNIIMEDVVLVNVESELPVALVNLRRELAATHVVAFGRNLLDVTLRNTQIYEPVLFPGLNLAYLSSATVDLVEYDVSLKKRLWPGLKAMFLG